ncbi:MAG: sulfite exporter TauE/SafE family protein [Candidatus Limnocylindrales bacterium]
MIVGLVLPIVALVVIAATLVFAPSDQHNLILLSTLVAVAAGLASASVGVYGGVLVPGLLLLGVDARFVAALSLFLQIGVIPIAAGSHYRLGHVSRGLVVPLVIGGTIGAFGGPFLAALLPKELIARLVAVLIILVGGVVLANHRLRGLREVRAENDVPTGRVAGIGLVAGFSSGVSGAGWGPLGVTSLILARIDPRQAVGSSLFARVFMALSAVGAFVLAQSAFHNVTPNWWIVVPLFFGSIAPMIPAALLVSRLGRERAIIGITLLSVALALPTLIFGH